MRKYFLFCLAVLISSAAAAADWQLVSTSIDGMKTYLDISSVTNAGTSRTTWGKTVYNKIRDDGTAYSVDHWRYDCSDRTIVLLSYFGYHSDGTVVTSRQVPSYSQQASDVVPDTVGETFFKLVCS